jgi:lantibiotic modifying enzyme
VGETVLNVWARPRMPWPCGIPDCGESPSLMTGSAGVGLHLLRLHDRREIPSILLPPLP